jgi:hypothetical protein
MKRRGDYGAVDAERPEAAGVCDRCGVVRKHRDLVQEMRWGGRGAVWSGLLCCPEHADAPHPQDLPRILRPDPVPIKDPRPPLPMVRQDWILSDGDPVGANPITDGDDTILTSLPYEE